MKLGVDFANDLVATDATGANVFADHGTILDDADFLHVDIPMTGALAIAVADVVACHSTLAAYTAHSRHNNTSLFLCLNIISRTHELGNKNSYFFYRKANFLFSSHNLALFSCQKRWDRV